MAASLPQVGLALTIAMVFPLLGVSRRETGLWMLPLKLPKSWGEGGGN